MLPAVPACGDAQYTPVAAAAPADHLPALLFNIAQGKFVVGQGLIRRAKMRNKAPIQIH